MTLDDLTLTEFLYRFGTAIGGFIIIIGPAVFFHELGHFLFAKYFGVKVFTFSLGFGPKIWSRTWRGTEYALSWIPFGGYVKMAGEDPGEERKGSPDEFASKPVWQRAVVIAAGPAANILMGFLICIFIFLRGPETPGFLPKVGQIIESSPASGILEEGDVITAINGQPVSSWQEIERFERSSVGTLLQMRVRRGAAEFDANVTPVQPVFEGDLPLLFRAQLATDRIFVGGNGTLKIVPWIDPVLGIVHEDNPAYRAGLQAGDKILMLDGKPVTQWDDLALAIRESPVGKPIEIVYARGGKEQTVTVTPKTTHAQGPDGKITSFNAIGIQAIVKPDPKPFFHATALAAIKTADLGRFIFVTLHKLITGEVSARLLAGPLGIAQGSGIQFREGGWMQLVYFLALISVNLGVVNLLPLPLLDGGWLFIFLTYEFLARRPMPQKIQERLMQAGIAMLLALVLFITWNDLGRIFGFQTVDDVMESQKPAEEK